MLFFTAPAILVTARSLIHNIMHAVVVYALCFTGNWLRLCCCAAAAGPLLSLWHCPKPGAGRTGLLCCAANLWFIQKELRCTHLLPQGKVSTAQQQPDILAPCTDYSFPGPSRLGCAPLTTDSTTPPTMGVQGHATPAPATSHLHPAGVDLHQLVVQAFFFEGYRGGAPPTGWPQTNSRAEPDRLCRHWLGFAGQAASTSSSISISSSSGGSTSSICSDVRSRV